MYESPNHIHISRVSCQKGPTRHAYLRMADRALLAGYSWFGRCLCSLAGDVLYMVWCYEMINICLKLVITCSTLCLGAIIGRAFDCNYQTFWSVDCLVRLMLRYTLIARFMGPMWGPSGADRTHVGPMKFAIWATIVMLCMQNSVFTEYLINQFKINVEYLINHFKIQT